MVEEVKSILLKQLNDESNKCEELEKKQNRRVHELREKLERPAKRKKKRNDCS